MQKFFATKTTFKGALDALKAKKVKGFKFTYDDQVYDEIFDKIGLEDLYLTKNDEPNTNFNIIDYNQRISPLTYFLNKRLNPKNHLIYPEGQASTKFWDKIKNSDDDMKNYHVLSTGISATVVKANILTKPLQDKIFTPDYLPNYTEEEIKNFYKTKTEPINPTILFVGDFMSTTQASALRTCLYFNEVKTSMFKYGGVKFLAWTSPNEILKFIGPLGSIHRRTNSLMVQLYSDVRIIACTENLKNPKAIKLLSDVDFVKLPYNDLEGEVCLVEFQSNHYKYKIDFPQELHLIIHKLFATPGAIVKDKLHVLGPGAEDYLSQQLSEETLGKKVSFVTEEELIKLSEEYYYWPFKPNTSLETFSSNDGFYDVD